MLEIPDIDENVDFFECGGDSLLMTTMLFRINEMFDVEVSSPAAGPCPAGYARRIVLHHVMKIVALVTYCLS